MYWTCVHLYNWRRSCSSCRRTFGQHSIARMQIKSTRTNHIDQQWQYGTMAVHAFKAVPDEQRWFYSQFGNACLRQNISSSQTLTSFTTNLPANLSQPMTLLKSAWQPWRMETTPRL